MAAADMLPDRQFPGRLVRDWSAALLGALVYIGDRNGLFAALAGQAPLTAGALARRTGHSPRYIAEWLAAMACAGYVGYDVQNRTFVLLPEMAASLAEPDRPLFLAGLFEMLPTLYANASDVARAFARGTGVPNEDYGADFRRGYERFSSAQLRTYLVRSWLPLMGGLEERLRSGCAVADVGCGNGPALALLAETFPRSRFVGYDCSRLAIDLARQRIDAASLAGRVSLEVRDVTDGLPEAFDLICAFDVIHEVADPVAALTAIRQALTPDGALLWTQLDVSSNLAENLTRGELGQIAYAMGTLYSMTTSMADGGAGIGCCLGGRKAEQLARHAGFSSFRRLSADHPFLAVYEARA